MRQLNLEQIKIVSGGNDISLKTQVHGYLYLTPTGEIKFNGFRIINPDGQEYWMGAIPEGWTRISEEIIVNY